MAEYQRTKDGVGNIYQWVDSEVHVVMDLHTGEFARFGPGNAASGNLEDALAFVKLCTGWETRYAIVPIKCIRGFRVS